MSGIFRRHRKATTAVGTVVALIAMMTVGFSYWTGGGSGTGTVKNANVADVVVSQTASDGVLAPGMSVPLSGFLTNPNTTDVKVGTLTATIAGVDSGATAADFTITGNGVLVNKVVKKGTPVAWSGMTLSYANTDVNQDTGKNATVSISYALAPFQESPTVVVPPLGTVAVLTDPVTGVQSLSIHINKVGSSTMIKPGDQLELDGYVSGTTTYVLLDAVAGANGEIVYQGSPTAAQLGTASQLFWQVGVNSNGVHQLGAMLPHMYTPSS